MSASKEYGKRVVEFLAFKSSSPKMKKIKAPDSNQESAKKVGEDDKEKLDTTENIPSASKDSVSHMKKRDVIIIGAGLSGLSAAKELRAYGLDVLVLEARERVGGRTLTKVENEGKSWVDLGASYVGPTQDSVLNLIDELNLETYLVDDRADISYLRASRRCRNPARIGLFTCDNIEYSTRFSPLSDPPLGNLVNWLDYVHMVKLIDSLGAAIPSDAPWNAPKAKEWDSITWKQFVDRNAFTKRVRGYFNNMLVTIDVCCDANEASLLWFLWYLKQCGGYGRAISTTNGGQERKIKGGTQQLSERLREIVGLERVLVSKPVHCIDQTSEKFATIATLDGSQFTADYVICALPPHLLLKIHHQPALPGLKNALAQRSPMGQVMKVILYYEKPFWKDPTKLNLSGCFLTDSVDRAAQPVVLSLDETKPDGSQAAIIGFVCAKAWLEMHKKDVASIARIVARQYVDTTSCDQFMNYTKVEIFDWANEQYSGGCYTTTHTPNTLTKFGKHLREPFGRIHYAGTETATKWSGYMDGALSSGKRAAREILYLMGRLNEDEIWQQEPESTSVPPKPFEYPSSHKYAPSIGGILRVSHITLMAGLVGLLIYRRIA